MMAVNSPFSLRTYIDRSSPIPYYVQIIQAIREQIENGNWQPGYQLPGEPELCQRFDVSRTVVRQALGELTYEGLVTRSRGRGTFVAEPKIGESLVQKLTGFYHDMVDRGYEPETEVLEQVITNASSKVANYLKLREGTPVLKLTRKRSVKGEAIVLVTTYLPHNLCKGLENEDFRKQSLYEVLETKYGIFIVSGRRTVEAVSANEYEARMLGIDKGAPLILLHSISYLENGMPIEYYHAVHRGDRTRFEVELVRYRGKGEDLRTLHRRNNLPQSSAIIAEEDDD
ncbi:MAG: GntR family transcriptional regulator [Chloroflexi bacterium RBG_16_48_8]|nr:MAG: GntR family transcriptional regulator [Chloroflexi bacterium RBG_16_48_8]